jgi:hypothetical protein
MKYLQDNRYNSQKLSVASELLAIVYLLPPSQPIVDTLVFSKWCSLLPVEEMISNLNEDRESQCENSKTDNRNKKVISMQSEDEHVNSCLDH